MKHVWNYVQAHSFQLLAAAWVWVAPIRPSLAAAVFFPLIDLVLALAADAEAKKPEGLMGHVRMVESSGLKRTAAKVGMYLAGITLAYVAETYLGVPYALRLACGLVGTTELKSCLEHLDALNGSSLYTAVLTQLAPPKREDDET